MTARAGLLLRSGVRHHRRHPLQAALAVLGIALGTALWVGIEQSLASASAAFERAATALTGRATHVLRGGPDGVPVAALATLARELGVAAAAPLVEGIARVDGRAERTVLRVFGCDPLVERELRPWAERSAAAAPLPVAELLTVPGAFVATARTLSRLGVGLGGALALRCGGRPLTGRCVGELPADAQAAAALDGTLIVDVATAQEWLLRGAFVDRIDLRLDAGTGGGARSAAAIAQRLGPAVRIEPAAGSSRFAELTAAFRINLRALSLLSLLVGAFLVHATMRLAVVARRSQFALLAALGAPAARLFGAVALEGALFGLLGSVLGALLGGVASALLRAPLLRTLNDHYATFELQAIEPAPWVLALAVLVGTAVAVLAALGPAREAARGSQHRWLAGGLTPAPTAGPAAAAPRRRAALAMLALLAATGALLLASAGARLALAYGGLLLLLVVAAALVPTALQVLLRALLWALRRCGPLLRYLLRSAVAGCPRTGLPLAALTLALATTVGLGILVASFRQSVTGWLEQALPADVYVGIPSGVDERRDAVLDDAVLRALLATPGVGAWSSYRALQLPLPARGGGTTTVEAVALRPSLRVLASFQFVAGEPTAARAAFAAGEGAFVSEPLAFRLGLEVGDAPWLSTRDGPRPLPIVGVFRDYGRALGVLMVPAAWCEEPRVGSLAFEAAPGTTPAQLAAALQRQLAGTAQTVQITEQRELRQRSLAVFDRTFAVTAALRWFGVLVACLGIYGAFATLQLDRTAEIGLLRALGAGPAQVGFLVLGQTALLGLAAGLLALPIGTGLGWVLVHVVNRGSFGWTLLGLELPAQVLFEALLLALLAALLAGLQPALQHARIRAAVALRGD